MQFVDPDRMAQAASEIADEQRAGAEHSLDELDRRLGLPPGFMAVAVAVWGAIRLGKPVTIIPTDTGATIQ